MQTCGQTAATSASTSAYLGRVAVSKNDAKKRATDRWGLSIVGEIARMISEESHRRFIAAFRSTRQISTGKCSVASNTPLFDRAISTNDKIPV